MMDLAQVQRHLADRKTGLVADACGLSYDTVWRVQKNQIKSVSYDVVKKLSDYIEGSSASA